ncbi:MAG TPA: C1 family peptidase [Mucilaginibacter sp.]|nr:C1 family peptidase [Mucilaginibacter sp.]
MLKPKCYFLLLLLLVIGKAGFSQDHGRGMLFDDSTYELQPRKAQLTRSLLSALPSSVSLKMYTPYPKNQLQYSTCVAWASAYCGRTMVDAIKNNWTDRDIITKKAYSPAFLFRLIQPNAGCNNGTYIDQAFSAMKNIGSIPFTNLPDLCVPAVDPALKGRASSSRLKDFATLFDYRSSNNIKVQAVKKALSEKKPVVIGMLTPPSFDGAFKCWQPKEQPSNAYGGHAMCVIGYDDSQYGGAFEVQNSWGDNWGNDGYMWIKYDDFARFVQYGYEFVDVPRARSTEPDLAGAIKLELASGEQMPVNLYVSTRGLKVVSAQTTTVQPLTIYKVSQAYTSGTNFRIYISNNQPAYVYAISSDLSNNVTKIFPYADNISAALDYKKNDVALPDEDHYIQFDNQPGTDFLCVLYSKTELDINDLMNKVSAGAGTFNERIYHALADKIVDPKNINFSSDHIGFQGASNDKDIVALMVELEHK